MPSRRKDSKHFKNENKFILYNDFSFTHLGTAIAWRKKVFKHNLLNSDSKWKGQNDEFTTISGILFIIRQVLVRDIAFRLILFTC